MMYEVPCESCTQSGRTIDDCYNQVIKRLTDRGKIKEVSSRLLFYKTYHEKVLYVYNVIKELQFLPIVKTNPKSDQVAIYYRNQGNTFFKQKQNYEAWQSYNLSLMYAEPMSQHFMYAVSNRSAVFFDMEKYEECMEDIKFVFSGQFPEKLRKKLLDRKEKCQAFLKAAETSVKKDPNDAKIAEILIIKGPKDERYVSASSKLKVVYTKEMGRHVIANEDIKVGDVLVQEDPYLTVLLRSQFVFCCAYCLSRKMNLYPCFDCTYSLYCSVECRDTAYRAYHMAECGLLPSVISMEFTKLEWLALRALLRSRTDTENWPQMMQIAEEAEARMNTDLWGCVQVGDKWVYDSKYYTSIHTLESNMSLRSMSDVFQKSVSAAVLTHFLTVLHFLKSDNEVQAEKGKKYVTDALLRHMMTAPTNMHSISANIEDADGNFVDECQIASGAYAFHSLLNHSCAPNVVRSVKLGTAQMSLIAIRPIKKGMQIFDNYGYHYAVHDRKERQAQLKKQYKFKCTCEACVDNWPKHEYLKEAKGVHPAIRKKKDACLSSEVLDKLMKADKETAVNCYGPLCELIEAFDPYAPCKELAECQEALKQCLAIFQGVIPHGYTKEVKWGSFAPCASTGGPPHLGGYISGGPCL